MPPTTRHTDLRTPIVIASTSKQKKRIPPSYAEIPSEPIVNLRGKVAPEQAVIFTPSEKAPARRRFALSAKRRQQFAEKYFEVAFGSPQDASIPIEVAFQGTDRVSQVREGYPHSMLDELASLLGVSQEQAIALLKLPRSTIKRNQSEGRPFSVEISDRLYRAQRLIEVSAETIGDRAAGIRWVQRPHAALGGATALSLVDTTAGYERVRDELERIANGVVA